MLTLPLMYGLQEMCARIGLVTDHGLIKLFKNRLPRQLLYLLALVVSAVIVLNLAADLAAISIILEKALSLNRLWCLLLTLLVILFFTIKLSYYKFAKVLKWLTLSLLFYVASVFFLQVDWLKVIPATLTINLNFKAQDWLLITAILGTTISPYLFFWQANEEVEERDSATRQKTLKRFLVTKHELKMMKEDVFTGMLLSNIVAWFLIVGGSRLGELYGIGEITSFEQAALILQPLLGPLAYLIFSLGIIGTALLTIPILAGCIGYIAAETFDWQEGINKTFRQAQGFYLTIIVAGIISLLINLLRIDPVQLLITTALAYGFITPPLILFILKVANDKKLMGDKKNNWSSNLLGALTFIIMTTAVLTTIWLYLK